jgi:hypothetical protein
MSWLGRVALPCWACNHPAPGPVCRRPHMEIRFKLERETKGALRYQAVDDKGQVTGWGQDRHPLRTQEHLRARRRAQPERPIFPVTPDLPSQTWSRDIIPTSGQAASRSGQLIGLSPSRRMLPSPPRQDLPSGLPASKVFDWKLRSQTLFQIVHRDRGRTISSVPMIEQSRGPPCSRPQHRPRRR